MALNAGTALEEYDRFIPTSLRPSGTHCQPKIAAVDYRFVGILDCRIRRPVKGAGEFERFVSADGVRVRHPRPLDRLEDGTVHRQGGAHWRSRRQKSCRAAR